MKLHSDMGCCGRGCILRVYLVQLVLFIKSEYSEKQIINCRVLSKKIVSTFGKFYRIEVIHLVSDLDDPNAGFGKKGS